MVHYLRSLPIVLGGELNLIGSISRRAVDDRIQHTLMSRTLLATCNEGSNRAVVR